MKAGPARQQFEQAQASATQDIKNLVGRAAGETAAMVPFAVAAPFTAGTSLPVGASIMGAAGLASGLAKYGTQKAIGSTEVPKGMELAMSLGLDTALGAGGETFGRGLFLGKTLLPKIVERAAARSEAGRLIMGTKYANMRQELYDAIHEAAIPKAPPEALVRLGEAQTGSVFVDVDRPLREAYAKLDRLPKAKGVFLSGETELTPDAAEAVARLEQDLKPDVFVGKMEPLDGLIRAKGNFQKRIYQSATINDEERPVLTELAADLHKIIKSETKALGPNVERLYNEVNELGITLNKATVAKTIAERFINTYTGRAVMGATVGAGEGYRRGGPGGAALGAAAGAGASVAIPGLATVIVQQTMKHPQGARWFSQALDMAIAGNQGKAIDLAGRAFAVAGVRNTLRDAFRQQPDTETFISP